MTVWAYPRIFIADIISEVAHVFGVTELDLKSKSRRHRFARPRFVCAYLGHRLTYLSYPQIGRVLGDRDHSTIIHAAREAQFHMGRDPEFRAYVDAVRIRLLTTRQREAQRLREAQSVKRARERREQKKAERAARVTTVEHLNDMDHLSNAVAEYLASGGSFVEVYA